MPVQEKRAASQGANIFVAAADGDLNRVRDLLDSGVLPDEGDASGYTPLHAASSYGHEEILKLLLERGGNVNTTDEDGDTALHACESVECAKILLDAGADATLRNDEEKTAAEIAVEEERSEVAELLRIRFPESFDASRVQAPEDEDEAYKARFQHLLQVAQEPEGVRDAYQASFQQLLQAAQAGDESKEKELVQLMERMVEDGTLGIEREDDQEEKEEEGGEEAPRAE